MKTSIKSILLIVVVLMASCDLPNNIDPKKASTVNPDVLFTNVEIQLFNQIGSVNVNSNVFRLLAQYQTEVTYVTESNYNFADRNLPDTHWAILYRDVLANAEETKKILNNSLFTDPQELKNKIAFTEILEVYAYHMLVDAFGNVPYTQALQGSDNSRPAYDDAKTVYYDLISRLDVAIADLTADAGSSTFGSADILYGGSAESWKAFANSLKLRMALRIADYDKTKAADMVQSAVASGVFTDQSQSAILHYTGVTPYVNSYYKEYILDQRKDYVPSNTLIDKLNGLNDPRRASWFTIPADSATYVGLKYGKAGKYSRNSHFNSSIINATYPVIISDFVEVEFLLAEAAARNIGGVTDAETHYNSAIKASMLYWGVSAADADTYLAQPAVAYATAGGSWQEKIGNQKWIGLFDRGIEGWNEWRRLDFPLLNPPPGMVYSDIPVRFPYPYNENKLNGTNYTAAAAAIGGDLISTKIFWDKH
jgi:hypothetical protein